MESAAGISTWGNARGKPGTRFQGLLHCGLAQKDLAPLTRGMRPTRGAQQRPRSRRWLGAGHRAPLPAVGPGSRPPAGKQASRSASLSVQCRPSGSGSPAGGREPYWIPRRCRDAGGHRPTLRAGLSGNKESGLTSIKPSLV